MTTNPLGIRDLLNLSPGEPVATTIHHQGLEYPGEVIVVPSWEASLGESLQGDSFFRIVFLQAYAAIASQELQDARIVVCVPSRSDRRREREIERERKVLREIRARYAVPEMEQALLDTQRQIYASGIVVAHGDLDIPKQAVFEKPSAQEWVSTMAETVLAWTYPRLPLDSSDFSRPLTADDAGLLFRGLLQGDTAPEVVSAVETFGAGLGLSTTQGCEEPESQGPLVLQMLQSEMAQRGGSWPCVDLYRWLAHVHGLPYSLVSLYLLVLLYRGEPPVELHLRAGHGLRLRNGEPYPGRVVVAETVSTLDFTPRLDAESVLVRYTIPVSWNTLSLYFSTLEPSLVPRDEVEEEGSVLQLLDTFKTLRADVRRVETAIGRLAASLEEELPEAASELLDRFRRLSGAQAPEVALQSARQLFSSPEGLAQGLTRYWALHGVVEMAGVLTTTVRYLREAYIPDDLHDLALQRQALLATLRLGELTATSFSPQVMQRQIARFRQEYYSSYAKHHGQYRDEMASLFSQLQEARSEAQGLERLNTIGELGEPVGADSLEQFHRLLAGLEVCPTPFSRLSLDRSPMCRRCGVVLGQRAPSQEAVSIIQEIERGLKEQNRRLSLRVIQRILHQPEDERIDRFIQVVQASDVSGLVNVLDDHMVEFLREVLTEP